MDMDSTRPLAPIVRSHRLAAAIATTVAVSTFVGAEIGRRTDALWFPFALVFAAVIVVGNGGWRTDAPAWPAECDRAVRLESVVRTVLRAALWPCVLAGAAITVSVLDRDRVYEPFVVGFTAGWAAGHWRAAHRYRRLESGRSATLVGYLPRTFKPAGDGAVWARPLSPTR